MGFIYKAIHKALLLFLISVVILAASCRNPASGRPSSTPTGPDKTELSKIISQAEDLFEELKESGQDGADVTMDKDWVESTWILECAIEAANIVLNNPKATAEDIQAALEDLTKAYNEFNTAKKPGKLGKIDVSELSELISRAQGLLPVLEVSADGKNVYMDTYWVSNAVKQALINAISGAQSEAAKDLSTQDAVDEALSALDTAYSDAFNAKRLGTFAAKKDTLQAQIAEAKLKIDGIKPSADGEDIPKYEKWVKSAIFYSLQTAITTAEALINNTCARQPAVDTAVQTLISAIAAFNPQSGLKPFDISQLSGLITNAQSLLAELRGLQESVDGTEVYEDTEWISATVKQALADAISTAQITADDEFVTPDAAEQAVDALTAVYQSARAAKKYGTFIANKAALQTQIGLAYAKMDEIETSKDGYDVLTSKNWVTSEMMDDLNAVLIAAITLDANPNARQEAVDATAQNLALAITAFTPKEGLLIPGLLTIKFTLPGDETITLTGDKTLSWKENTELIVSVAELFNSYQWYVDGVIKAGETGTIITLNARDFSPGSHTVTLKVMKGSVPYTKTLKFTVN